MRTTYNAILIDLKHSISVQKAGWTFHFAGAWLFLKIDVSLSNVDSLGISTSESLSSEDSVSHLFLLALAEGGV